MTKDRFLRPDAQLVRLHAERGDPHLRLGAALAALEDTDWGLLLAGEVALARQLAALLGPGTLRVDGRLDVSRAALAEAGLAVADLHGDLGGARAVWLLEPDRAAFDRARRAGVKIIVDGTLAPGGGWAAQGADYVVYRNGVTLTGYADAPLAALFGQGRAPEPAAPPPSDLAVALALRDVATLPLRLARFARTVTNLSERLGASVRQAGPTALLLPPDAAADTSAPLGGVLAAARHVPDGLLLTPGLEDTDNALGLLRGENPLVGRESYQPEREQARSERPREDRTQDERPRSSREDRSRSERPRGDWNRDERDRNRRDRFRPQPDRPADRREREQADHPDELSRFTFEAPEFPAEPQPERQKTAEVPPVHPVSEPEEQLWEPEIVFSNLEHSPVPLTHTVSSGPDAAPLAVVPPLAEAEDAGADTEVDASATDMEVPEEAVQEESASAAIAEPVVAEPVEPLAPDLPSVPTVPDADGPAADLTEEQAAIYARLREWRNAEAKRQEISRFIVASNAALAEIARRVPYTLDDLAAVRGMGPARLQKYGDKILEVVRG